MPFQRVIEQNEALKHDPDFEELMPVCTKIFQFGSCSKFSHCKKRHVFVERDKSVNIPCDGLVKFELAGIHNPSHYAIKIREYLPAGERVWISREQQLQKIENKLELLQTILSQNEITQVPLKTNDLCAVFCTKNHKWCRCKVLEKE